ncbi:hypothetical protein [Chryseobacterium sp. MYb328]|uniref:hypothetical protein n=1 Tax=Chryseobacterium sp. MYb328 TaxID=2745231 RepID=UPI00309C7247
MKKTTIDYLNFGLAGIFIGMLILYGVTLLQKKEFDRLNWSAKIIGIKPESVDEKPGMLKILDAVFINSFNKYVTKLDDVSPLLIFSHKESDSGSFRTQNDLLPDSLSVKYFSFEDKKFYHLNAKLSLEKMYNCLEDKDLEANLKIEIHPGGKISLKVEQPESENFGTKLIHNFQAKEIPGTLKMLVDGSDRKEYDFSLMKGLSDYSDILTQKYLWEVKIETEGSEDILNTSAYNFYGKSIRTDNETFEDVLLRDIPESIVIKWGNKQHYEIGYSFDGQEILDAFKDLDKIKSSEPAVITFKLLKNSLPKAEISKAGKTIKLKDTYPNYPAKINYRLGC